MIDTIASDVSLAISGLFVLVAAVLLVLRLRWRKQMRRQPWSLSALADLSRDDVDPGWPEVWATFPGHANDLTEVPPEWDPCIVRDPRTPQRGDSHDNT